MSDGRKEQEKKPVCSCPRVRHSKKEENVSICFLKSPKAINRNRIVFPINILKALAI